MIFFEAFYGISNITSVVIIGSIKHITTFVFEKCSSLKEIILKEGVISIGVCSFSN